ncbi:MAG: MHYT domain-containing protein [Bryobacteraceae bacterium]
MSSGTAIEGVYNLPLVALSVAIAISASYAALRLGSRTSAARGLARIAWVAGGGCAMGFGIWSMHYVGMLAFTLPIPVRYDLPTVTWSLVAAILASGIALYVVSREIVTRRDAVLGSLFMGAGIVTMHYTGMAAMRLSAACHYEPLLLVASGAIAVLCSLAALWLTFRLRSAATGASIWKILSAVAMGIAIAAMHYTGMAAARFEASSAPVDYSNAVSVSSLGMAGIVIVTFLVLGVAIFTSIIDQRLAAHRALAEELYRSRRMLRSILDNIPQRVFWKDGNGRYLGCNRAFAQDAGLQSPEEIDGKSDNDLAWREHIASYSDDFQLAVRKGEPIINSEYQIGNGAGHERWLQASSIPLYDSNGVIFGILGAYEDITGRKRSEDAIKRSNAALSDFAHVVSHDLQSPLRVAKNYIQLLAKKYGTRLDQSGHEFLGLIEDNIVHMDELIASLLRYATATEPDPEGETEISLDDAVDRALLNLQLLIKETHAEITSGPLPTVTGHPAQLVQVLQNLISNAVKYRSPDSAPRIHLSAIEKPQEWIVSVKDNGIGVAPEYQAQIFTPLKRLHGREIPGFGIGLATCRKVVEHHGGRMWIESTPGAGSTFYFTLRKTRTLAPHEVA